LGFTVLSSLQAIFPNPIKNNAAKINFFMFSICLSLKYEIVLVESCHVIFDFVFKVLDEKQKENLRFV
jgi:hypothetical protein